MEMTTDEILNRLPGQGFGGPIVNLCQVLLSQSDLVKFAKHVPSRIKSEHLLTVASDIVSETQWIQPDRDLEPPSNSTAIESVSPGVAEGGLP